MSTYVRHCPESSVLYQTVARVWPGLSMEYCALGEPIAEHVETEFERYLRCGILQHGFVRLRCPSCKATRVVGFSCKRRGFCASCGVRRMEQTASRLEQEVWPAANARQFVLTFPHQVRHWLSRSEDLLSEVILAVTDVIREFYEEHTLRHTSGDLTPTQATSGAITFVQLFGSSLNLNPHLHMVFLDGVYAKTRGGIRKQFFAFERFDTDCVLEILHGIYVRLERLFRRRGFSRDDDGDFSESNDDEVVLPFRPRSPKAYRRMGKAGSLPPHALYHQVDPEKMSVEGWCNVRGRWFSLHAGVAIKGEDRHGLKRLFRYVSRSSVPVSRLTYADPEDRESSDLLLALKRPWRDGTESLRFKQIDFVERLATLVPRPWWNLTRYEGLFAPGHTWRASVVPGPKHARPSRDLHDPPPPARPSSGRAVSERYIPWAELLRRTLGIDPEICSCGSKMVVVDSVVDAKTIAEVMVEMGLSATPPPRGRRTQDGELSYLFE